MKQLRTLGIIGGAALLIAAPFSLQWSHKNALLSLDSAEARTGRPLTATRMAGVRLRVHRWASRCAIYGTVVFCDYPRNPFNVGADRYRPAGHLVSRFRSSHHYAARSLANFGIKGTLAIYDSSAVFGFEVPTQTRGWNDRNFKSTALAADGGLADDPSQPRRGSGPHTLRAISDTLRIASSM